VLSGELDALEPYQTGISRLPGHERILRDYAAGDSELSPLVARQE